MPFVLANRVQETTTSTGTGSVTLAGAVPGFQSFAAIGDANNTYYTIAGGTEWEVGIGTYTAAGTTLSRDTVLSSSAGGTTKVNFSAGTKNVFVSLPTERTVYSGGTANLALPAPGTSANVLTSNGTAWVSQASSNTWVLLASVDASTSATVSFESGFDTTKYDEYVVVGENILGTYTAASDNLFMEFKLGGTYQTSNYAANLLVTSSNSTTTNNITQSTSLQVFYQSTANITQKTGALGSFEAHFFGFQDLTGVMPRYFWTAVHPAGGPSGGYMRTVRGGGGYLLADYNTFGGVKFYFGNGNISTGRFRLYGIKKS